MNPTVNDDTPPALTMIRLMTGFWISRAIYVAAKLGISDLLDEPKGIDELAKATGSHGPSLYRTLRALASIGIFAEDEQGRFTLTPLGATLRSDVPGSLRAWINMQSCEEHYRAWGDILHSVQSGESAFDHIFGMGPWQYRAQNPQSAKVFDEAMTSLTGVFNAAVLSSYSFSRFNMIVDVGGGNGSLLSAVLEANPGVRGVLFDLPRVIEKAAQRIATSGLRDRCQAISGDAFASVPAGGDAYILSRVIHDWDDERAIAILRNCRRAMVEDGKLLLIEGIVEARNRPDISKFVDRTMLVLSGGRERTAAEYESLLGAAGFNLTQIVPISSVMGLSIIESTPARNLDGV